MILYNSSVGRGIRLCKTSMFTITPSSHVYRAHAFSVQRAFFSTSSPLRSKFYSWHHLPSSLKFAVSGSPRPRTAIFSVLYKAAGVTSIGLGLSAFWRPKVLCEGPVNVRSSGVPIPQDLPPPPKSTVSLYELGFGTVAGICAGVFIKKGAKAIAFLLGGVFVLLQYLSSSSMIRVDWARMSSRFESLFYRTDAAGSRAPSTLSLWSWIVDFLTADFQPRASFVAGLALGLRVG